MGRSGLRPTTRKQICWDRRKEDRAVAQFGAAPTGCGKRCYPSKSEAKSALRRSIGSGTMTEKDTMNLYRCENCQAWHIGHDRKLREGARGAS